MESHPRSLTEVGFRLSLVAGFAAAVAAAAAPKPGEEVTSPTYEAEIQEWRAQRQKRLTADDGWLTVAGLFWLHPGENRFGSAPENPVHFPEGSAPGVAGVFILDEAAGKVTVKPEPGIPIMCTGWPVKEEMVLKSDADAGGPDVLALKDLRFFLIKRSKGYGIRMRNLNAPARKSFTGLDYFPIDAGWRIQATFKPYKTPKPIPIANIVGTVDTMQSPGYVEFKREGKKYRVEPVLESPEDKELFFIFRDETSGVETYPPGRFLYSDLPVGKKVILDFNKAYNPPCAFTEFATCPLPPLQNHLQLRVTAGEKRYGH